MPTVVNFDPVKAKAGDTLHLYHKARRELFTGYVTSVPRDHDDPWWLTPSEDPTIGPGRIEYRLPVESSKVATIKVLIFDLPDDLSDDDLGAFARLSADLRGIPFDGTLNAAL